MEVAFLDVGFGTCNLVLAGGGEAIVIDAGERSKEPLAALHHFSINRIRHLIVSHWHDDHVGGATGVLRAYSGRIGTVWFPADPAFKRTAFWPALVEEVEAGSIEESRIADLKLDGARPRVIWAPPRLDAELLLISPSFYEATTGVAAEDPNATCGVLVLRVGSRFVVFAGDATLAQWQQVHKRISVPLTADVLAVPHHAGAMWPGHWSPLAIATALDNLYSKVVKPGVVVISASTTPGVKHPREDVVAALRRAKAHVLCTQMTNRCAADLESIRDARKSLPLVAPGRASDTRQDPTREETDRCRLLRFGAGRDPRFGCAVDPTRSASGVRR